MSDIITYWKDRKNSHSVPYTECGNFVGEKEIKIYELTGNIDDCTINFYILEDFYKILIQPPLKLENDNHKAYIFGSIFPAESYRRIGYHLNEMNLTGVFDVTDMTREDEFIWYHTDIFNKLNQPWDNEKNRLLYRNETPRILFLGHTFLNSGVVIYTHSTNNIVDGLILDENYCFTFGY
jgi:hypothetical protein